MTSIWGRAQKYISLMCCDRSCGVANVYSEKSILLKTPTFSANSSCQYQADAGRHPSFMVNFPAYSRTLAPFVICCSLGDFFLFFAHTHRRPSIPAYLDETSHAVVMVSRAMDHSQQMTSMHEGVIRDRPALPAPSEHRSLVIHQPCFTAYELETLTWKQTEPSSFLSSRPLLGVQGSDTGMLSKDRTVLCLALAKSSYNYIMLVTRHRSSTRCCRRGRSVCSS